MERFCGHLKRGGAASKRFPYKSLDRYLFDWTILWHLGAVYNLRDTLKLVEEQGEDGSGRKGGEKLEMPECESDDLVVVRFAHATHDADRCVLMGQQPLSVDPTSDIFLLVLGGVMRYFPELQVDPYVAWKVQGALTAATFNEWTRFKKNNLQDIFYSTSQSSEKVGARDAQFARVSWLPPVRSWHHHSTFSFSTRHSTPPCSNQWANTPHPSHTMDASNTLCPSHSLTTTKTFTCIKEQLSHLRCFTGAFSHKRTRDWIV